MPNLLKYDVIYILDPLSTAEEITAVSSKVEQIVNDAKGTVLKRDDWGKRRLAYMVKKHREGHYVFFHVSVTPETVAEITRNLRLLEKVIKFSIVKDTISHLKAKVKPPRVGKSADTSGAHSTHSSHSRSGPPRSSSSAPTNPAPAAHSTVSAGSPQGAPAQAVSPQAAPSVPPTPSTNP